jgi:hypothetical protein
MKNFEQLTTKQKMITAFTIVILVIIALEILT